MSNSSLYINLEKRINQLIQDLLPTIDTSLQYSDKDITLTNAFYLLCHAEIEVYIEEIIRKVAKDAYCGWNTNKTNITPIIFHLACNYNQEINQKKQPPYSMICIAYNNLNKLIDKNNGIKENDIDNLLRYIGFEMDHTLKTTLDVYGKVRGQIAHKSPDPQNPPDPAIAKRDVQQILSGLAIFDIEIIQYSINSISNRFPVYFPSQNRMSLLECLKKLFRKR